MLRALTKIHVNTTSTYQDITAQELITQSGDEGSLLYKLF